MPSLSLSALILSSSSLLALSKERPMTGFCRGLFPGVGFDRQFWMPSKSLLIRASSCLLTFSKWSVFWLLVRLLLPLIFFTPCSSIFKFFPSFFRDSFFFDGVPRSRTEPLRFESFPIEGSRKGFSRRLFLRWRALLADWGGTGGLLETAGWGLFLATFFSLHCLMSSLLALTLASKLNPSVPYSSFNSILLLLSSPSSTNLMRSSIQRANVLLIDLFWPLCWARGLPSPISGSVAFRCWSGVSVLALMRGSLSFYL